MDYILTSSEKKEILNYFLDKKDMENFLKLLNFISFYLYPYKGENCKEENPKENSCLSIKNINLSELKNLLKNKIPDHCDLNLYKCLNSDSNTNNIYIWLHNIDYYLNINDVSLIQKKFHIPISKTLEKKIYLYTKEIENDIYKKSAKKRSQYLIHHKKILRLFIHFIHINKVKISLILIIFTFIFVFCYYIHNSFFSIYQYIVELFSL